MSVHRTETTLSEDGKLTLEDLPFQAGDIVEVIVLDISNKQNGRDGQLRGSVIKYDSPTEPVGVEDWDLLK